MNSSLENDLNEKDIISLAALERSAIYPCAKTIDTGSVFFHVKPSETSFQSSGMRDVFQCKDSSVEGDASKSYRAFGKGEQCAGGRNSTAPARCRIAYRVYVARIGGVYV